MSYIVTNILFVGKIIHVRLKKKGKIIFYLKLSWKYREVFEATDALKRIGLF
jgi:hypothetical protein